MIFLFTNQKSIPRKNYNNSYNIKILHANYNIAFIKINKIAFKYKNVSNIRFNIVINFIAPSSEAIYTNTK